MRVYTTSVPICDGVNALGACSYKAKFVLTPAVPGRKGTSHACGVHLAQVIKNRLPSWGAVRVVEPF